MNYFGYVLGWSIFGNVLSGTVLRTESLETIPTANKIPSLETKKIPRKKQQRRTKKNAFLKDFETGIEYRELKETFNKVTVEVKYPDGQTDKYEKSIKDAMTAFPNEALKKCLEEEEFYDEKKEFVLQAISERSIKKLKKVLTNLNLQEFIAHCPNLLDEVLWCLSEMDADEKLRKIIMNTLRRFGYFIK
jgi:hypothetical protein